MKQVIQSVNSGVLSVVEVPVPLARAGNVLVVVAASLVSAGTERMIVDFAGKSLLDKARSRPDLARQTIEKARREGLLTTVEAVQNRLDQPMALGYSCAGTVVEVGAGVTGLQIGDKVACGGQYAGHAEMVSVPKNLVVKLADDADLQAAAYTTLGAIALQGIRLAEVSLGEVVAVIGLGLLGQLTIQMLKRAGCIVLGLDIQPARAELGRQLGADAVTSDAEQFAALCLQYSNGHGADAVLITADTKSNQPVELAGEIARDKGKVVAVGAVGLTVPRKPYYEKELDLRISRSYGPGRYDLQYEDKGHDYPYGYVRWTEGRNMAAFAHLLASDAVNVAALTTHRVPIAEAARAYEVITGRTGEPFLGVLLIYPETAPVQRKIAVVAVNGMTAPTEPLRLDEVRLGVIGAGNFANATLLPAIKDIASIKRVAIASSGGLTARTSADRFGFSYATTDTQQILADKNINTIAILTRHDLHARQVIAGLQAGKHVYVEKPLCLTEDELEDVAEAYRLAHEQAARDGTAAPILHVGYNRRFAPFVVELKQHLRGLREPLLINCRVNAGFIPPNHWLQDREQGGGRLLGEGCHFIDLLIHLAGSRVYQISTLTMPNGGRYADDNLVVTLQFANGSLGTLTYVANGDKGFGKELIEVFGGGLAARLDDYRTLTISHGSRRVTRAARLRQDKGHQAEWQVLAAHLTAGGPVPIPFEEILFSTRTTLAAQKSRDLREPIALG